MEAKSLRASLRALTKEVDAPSRSHPKSSTLSTDASLSENDGASRDGPTDRDKSEKVSHTRTEHLARQERHAKSSLRELAQSDPEYHRLRNIQQKSQLDGQYAMLFKKLNLQGTQLEKFKELLVDKKNIVKDVTYSAEASGATLLNNPGTVIQALNTARSEVDSEIKQMLGDSGYAHYQRYIATGPERAVTTQLTQALSYTKSPLSDEQAEKLIDIIASHAEPPKTPQPAVLAANGSKPGHSFFDGATSENELISSREITPGALAAASAILSAPQMEALRRIHEAQTANYQMSALIAKGTSAPHPGLAEKR